MRIAGAAIIKIRQLITPLFVVACSMLLSYSLCRAEVIRYVDENGQTNYVSGPEKVPQKYQDQLSKQKPLPEITKLPAREFDAQIKTLNVPEHSLRPEKSAAKAGKVEVFVTDWCPYCKKLEAFLKAKKVQYTRYNIERDKKGAKLHAQLGGGGVPVLRVGSQVIHGFDQAQVASALRLN